MPINMTKINKTCSDATRGLPTIIAFPLEILIILAMCVVGMIGSIIVIPVLIIGLPILVVAELFGLIKKKPSE